MLDSSSLCVPSWFHNGTRPGSLMQPRWWTTIWCQAAVSRKHELTVSPWFLDSKRCVICETHGRGPPPKGPWLYRRPLFNDGILYSLTHWMQPKTETQPHPKRNIRECQVSVRSCLHGNRCGISEVFEGSSCFYVVPFKKTTVVKRPPLAQVNPYPCPKTSPGKFGPTLLAHSVGDTGSYCALVPMGNVRKQ